jgi:hypothetical protein
VTKSTKTAFLQTKIRRTAPFFRNKNYEHFVMNIMYNIFIFIFLNLHKNTNEKIYMMRVTAFKGQREKFLKFISDP